jgi:hypothetical protein
MEEFDKDLFSVVIGQEPYTKPSVSEQKPANTQKPIVEQPTYSAPSSVLPQAIQPKYVPSSSTTNKSAQTSSSFWKEKRESFENYFEGRNHLLVYYFFASYAVIYSNVVFVCMDFSNMLMGQNNILFLLSTLFMQMRNRCLLALACIVLPSRCFGLISRQRTLILVWLTNLGKKTSLLRSARLLRICCLCFLQIHTVKSVLWLVPIVRVIANAAIAVYVAWTITASGSITA